MTNATRSIPQLVLAAVRREAVHLGNAVQSVSGAKPVMGY